MATAAVASRRAPRSAAVSRRVVPLPCASRRAARLLAPRCASRRAAPLPALRRAVASRPAAPLPLAVASRAAAPLLAARRAAALLAAWACCNGCSATARARALRSAALPSAVRCAPRSAAASRPAAPPPALRRAVAVTKQLAYVGFPRRASRVSPNPEARPEARRSRPLVPPRAFCVEQGLGVLGTEKRRQTFPRFTSHRIGIEASMNGAMSLMR